MTPSTRPDRAANLLGRTSLKPLDPVIAGELGQWTLTYTVGDYGIDEGGTIKIARRFASDWQTPQFDQPREPGYTTVRTTGPARLAVRFDRKAHYRPWMRCLVIDVYDASLAPGDEVIVVFGDQSQGSPGIRAQTFQESHHELRVFVDPTNACQVDLVPDYPTLAVIPGQPVKLKMTLPSQAVVGEVVNIHLRGEDIWGNPTAPWPDIELKVEGDIDASIHSNQLTAQKPGRAYLTTKYQGQFYCSNPIVIAPAAQNGDKKLKRFWGDMHGQSDATVGTGTETQYFTFARDMANLDFTGHQGNDFQVTDDDWRRLNKTIGQFHKDGSFVIFPGYEWSANTTAGGDRNIFYLSENQPIIRSSAWQIAAGQATDLNDHVPATKLYQALRQKVGVNQVMVVPHVGGRYADVKKYFDNDLEPVVEVVSCWGVFEWLLFDALEQGYVVGVTCNSDGHKGRPGAEGPGAGDFGIVGGLTCALAENLNRQDIFNAIKSRRCYGTTGARMILDFSIDNHLMGEIFEPTSDTLNIRASVIGCGPLERLQLYRGRQLVSETWAPAFDDVAGSNHIRITWKGSRIRGRGRRVTWNGHLKTSSAVILTAKPYSFDSPSDGLHQTEAHRVDFESHTTGDTDGIDLVLDHADQGTLSLYTPVGQWNVDLAELQSQPVVHDCGGIDMAVEIRRYPSAVKTRELTLNTDLLVPSKAESTPYFVKAIQCDGQMAWASPVYVMFGASLP